MSVSTPNIVEMYQLFTTYTKRNACGNHLVHIVGNVASCYNLLSLFNFQLQPVFVNCIGDLFENQVVLFEGILKSGRYAAQVWDHSVVCTSFSVAKMVMELVFTCLVA